MSRNKKHHKNKISVVIATSLVLLAALGFIYLRYRTQSNAIDTKNTAEQGTINYGPPTEQEQKSGDIKKQEIADEDSDDTPKASTGNTANVIITDATQYEDDVEVRAFVNNDFREGMCKMTFTKGALSVTKKAPAYPDATTTICTVPKIKRSDFAEAGKWQLTVSYSSEDASGSATQEVVIE